MKFRGDRVNGEPMWVAETMPVRQLLISQAKFVEAVKPTDAEFEPVEKVSGIQKEIGVFALSL